MVHLAKLERTSRRNKNDVTKQPKTDCASARVAPGQDGYSGETADLEQIVQQGNFHATRSSQGKPLGRAKSHIETAKVLSLEADCKVSSAEQTYMGETFQPMEKLSVPCIPSSCPPQNSDLKLAALFDVATGLSSLSYIRRALAARSQSPSCSSFEKCKNAKKTKSSL